MPPTNIPKACPCEGGGAGLAVAPSALDVHFTPDLGLLAQRRREFLFQDDPPTHPPRRVPLDCRPAGRHQCLSRRAQEATADGQDESVLTVEAEIDCLLREKEEIEKWAVVGSA